MNAPGVCRARRISVRVKRCGRSWLASRFPTVVCIIGWVDHGVVARMQPHAKKPCGGTAWQKKAKKAWLGVSLRLRLLDVA